MSIGDTIGVHNNNNIQAFIDENALRKLLSV